jgi:hypothetical protein
MHAVCNNLFFDRRLIPVRNIGNQVAVYYLNLWRQCICKDIHDEYGVQL